MKHLERFVELCLETWPDEPVGIDIIPTVTGERGLQVRISRWLSPAVFRESDLNDPRAMIRTVKRSMDDWMPLKV
jgi:hypothetical protein